MAHDLNTDSSGKIEFVAKGSAWHGLGINVEKAMTSRECLTLSGLDKPVHKLPARIFNPDTGEYYNAPGFCGTVRDGKVLGIVKSRYEVCQDVDAFSFMDSLVADKLAMYESAGVLSGGKITWILAKIPKEYKINEEDEVKPYVLLINSHDGSKAINIIPTSIRVVCRNTLNMALDGSENSGIRIRHSGNINNKVREARQALDICIARFDSMDEEMHRMCNTSLTEGEAVRYFRNVLPDSNSGANTRKNNIRSRWLANFYSESNSLKCMKGSVWAAYNAVSDSVEHRKPRKNGDSLYARWFGQGNKIKQNAYNKALEISM